MSSDEPVEDPYLALRVAKDADISAIRSAQRKLVLKYHPDRLKGEEEQAKGKDAFQKVHQAYEILSDPTTRARYDNKVKLAQLKKEAMARDLLPRTAAYPMRPPPPSTPNREYRDGKVYEERTPNPSYFDESYRYRDEEPRTTFRKYDGYERERRPDFGQPEKERKSTKWPEKTASELPFGIALKFKVKAQKTRDAVKEKAREKAREKEIHASSTKSRDRDHRSARMDKQSSRRAYVEDDYSSSDSDTVTYATINRPSQPRPSKSPYDFTPRSEVPVKMQKVRETVKEKTREKEIRASRAKSRDRSARMDKQSSRRAYVEDDYSSSDSDTVTYATINRPSQPRPSKSPYDSTPRPRSKPEPPEDRHRRTRSPCGSDNDTRPRSSKGRRPSIDAQETRPPPMPSHNSAPAGVATMKAQLDKDASRPRAQTMLSSKSRKGDAVPVRGSLLKHAEIHDSGYGSYRGQTPDLSGISPLRYGPTRYQFVEDEDDLSTILVNPEDRHRWTTSPSRGGDRRDRPQRPTVSTDSRPRFRGASYQHSPIEVEPRSTSYRQDSARSTQPRSSSPRESPFGSRKMDRNEPFTVPYPNVKTSPRVNEKDIKYSQHARRPSRTGSPLRSPCGSDNDTRPRSSKGRRPSIDSQKLEYAEIHNSGYGSSGGQTPDLSGTSPPRHGTTRYQIVEDEDNLSTILFDPEDRHRRTTSPSPPLWVRDCHDHPQRPTVSTDSRPRSSRGTSYHDYTGPDDSRGRSL